MTNKELVKRFIDTKAVDFASIAKVISEFGPAVALSDEPEDRFCGTGPRFLVLYKIANVAVTVEQPEQLRSAAAGELR